MARTPEGKVKLKVAKQLASVGAYFFYPATGGYGSSGVPDIVGCLRGRFFAIECKAGNAEPTALQKSNLNSIVSAGGFAMVVNELNVDTVATEMEKL